MVKREYSCEAVGHVQKSGRDSRDCTISHDHRATSPNDIVRHCAMSRLIVRHFDLF